MIAAIALAASTACLVISVHDGDGIRCDGEKIRIANIDAHEIRGSIRCSAARVEQLRHSANPAQCDHAVAERSRDALRAFLSSGDVVVHRTGRKSYDRSLATVTVNGRDAGEYLVSMGLARRWVGR